MAAFVLLVLLCLGVAIWVFTQFFSQRLTKILLDYQAQGVSSEILAQLRADPQVDLEHLSQLLGELPLEGEGLWHLSRDHWLKLLPQESPIVHPWVTTAEERELVLESLKLDSADAVLDMERSLGRIREILWSSRVAHPGVLELSLVLRLKSDEVALLNGEVQPGFPEMTRSPVLASMGRSASFLPTGLLEKLHPEWPKAFRRVNSGGRLQTTLTTEEGVLGVLRIKLSDQQARSVVAQQTSTLVVASSLAALVLGGGFLLLAAFIRRSSSDLVTKPLASLSQVLKEVDQDGDGHISRQNIDDVLPALRNFQQELQAAREIDEITRAARSHLELLSSTLAENEAVQLKLKDALSRLEEATGALVQSSKGWMLTELGAWVAHDLNNKLQGAYSISSNWIERDKPCPVKHLRFLHLSLEKSIEQIDQFSNLSRPQGQDLVERVEACSLFEDLQLLVSQRVQQAEAELNLEISKDLVYLNISPGKFQDMLMNLVFNACDSIEERKEVAGRIEIVAQGRSISVRDNGLGIEEADIPKLFDRPFFTTKTGGGTGLGLRIVSSIAAEFKGTVVCQSALGESATFTVTLGAEHVEAS